MDPNNNCLTVSEAADGTISVVGDIDMAGGPLLEAAIEQREAALGTTSSGDIVLDLEAVHFIDSSGLRSLLTAARRAGHRHSALTLHAVGPEIIRLLEITGTLDQFTIASRRD